MIDIALYIDEPTSDRLNELSGIHGLLYRHELKEVIVKRFGMHIYEGGLPDDYDAEKFGYELCDAIRDWHDATIERFLKMSQRQ